MSVPQEVLYRMAMEAEAAKKQVEKQIREEEEREWFGTYGVAVPEEDVLIAALRKATAKYRWDEMQKKYLEFQSHMESLENERKRLNAIDAEQRLREIRERLLGASELLADPGEEK